jgi:hypothetical protein
MWDRASERSAVGGGGASGSSGGIVDVVKIIEEAPLPSESLLRRAALVLDNSGATRKEIEPVLKKLCAWISEDSPSYTPQAFSLFQASQVHSSVVRTMRRYRDLAPVAAAACVLAARSSRSSVETTNTYIRAGVLEEILAIMDAHPTHGGIQNVTLLLLADLMKDSRLSEHAKHTSRWEDSSFARQAVSAGAITRVLRGLESTNGRQVQYNGCVVLRLLLDNGRAPRAGLQEVAMRAKAAHQNDEELCAVADDVLSLVTPRFKEVLCWHYQSGWCRLGPRCTYAHGPEELALRGRHDNDEPVIQMQ